MATVDLRLTGLHKRFEDFVALDGVDLEVTAGELVCLLGPSGCGKTTLLRCIAGLERQDAGHILVCSGHDYQTLLAEQLATLEPQVCRLQMLRARCTRPLDLQHAVLTGLSCVHYGAFADLPEAAAIRAEIRQQQPELATLGIHLLMSPTPQGDLIIGDSHDYGSDASPLNAEHVDRLLLELAEQTLGDRLEVLERWQGVYGARGPGPYSVLEVDPQITAVLMHTGLGMSIGLALGERTIAELF